MSDTAGTQTFFTFPETENELDLWILSALQTTIKSFQTAFENYELDNACRVIPPFIDQLNNWYLRRGRKRFWANGLSEDKVSGYETLHYVLRTLAQVLAPICPFFAEQLWLDLGGQDSVHLQFFPQIQEHWINPKTEAKISLMRDIVKLSAGIRARKKIKLRQPLAQLQFAINGEIKLNKAELDIIAAEANVKNIEILENPETVAQRVIKVDASKVGRKFGKKTQALIQAGKAGEFTLKENGQVEIQNEILEAGEYKFFFFCEAGREAEASSQSIVVLNTELDESLRYEGYARELIRAIQETRKSQGFEVTDRINISYQTKSEDLHEAITQFQDLIAGETLAEEVSLAKALNGQNLDIDEHALVLVVEKI
jgi:isoleucyl-tRNA synthetase